MGSNSKAPPKSPRQTAKLKIRRREAKTKVSSIRNMSACKHPEGSNSPVNGPSDVCFNSQLEKFIKCEHVVENDVEEDCAASSDEHTEDQTNSLITTYLKDPGTKSAFTHPFKSGGFLAIVEDLLRFGGPRQIFVLRSKAITENQVDSTVRIRNVLKLNMSKTRTAIAAPAREKVVPGLKIGLPQNAPPPLAESETSKISEPQAIKQIPQTKSPSDDFLHRTSTKSAIASDLKDVTRKSMDCDWLKPNDMKAAKKIHMKRPKPEPGTPTERFKPSNLLNSRSPFVRNSESSKLHQELSERLRMQRQIKSLQQLGLNPLICHNPRRATKDSKQWGGGLPPKRTKPMPKLTTPKVKSKVPPQTAGSEDSQSHEELSDRLKLRRQIKFLQQLGVNPEICHNSHSSARVSKQRGRSQNGRTPSPKPEVPKADASVRKVQSEHSSSSQWSKSISSKRTEYPRLIKQGTPERVVNEALKERKSEPVIKSSASKPVTKPQKPKCLPEKPGNYSEQTTSPEYPIQSLQTFLRGEQSLDSMIDRPPQVENPSENFKCGPSKDIPKILPGATSRSRDVVRAKTTDGQLGELSQSKKLQPRELKSENFSKITAKDGETFRTSRAYYSPLKTHKIAGNINDFHKAKPGKALCRKINEMVYDLSKPQPVNLERSKIVVLFRDIRKAEPRTFDRVTADGCIEHGCRSDVTKIDCRKAGRHSDDVCKPAVKVECGKKDEPAKDASKPETVKPVCKRDKASTLPANRESFCQSLKKSLKIDGLKKALQESLNAEGAGQVVKEHFDVKSFTPALKESLRARGLIEALKKTFRTRELAVAYNKSIHLRPLGQGLKKSFKLAGLKQAIKESLRAEGLGALLKDAVKKQTTSLKYGIENKMDSGVVKFGKKDKTDSGMTSEGKTVCEKSEKTPKKCAPKVDKPGCIGQSGKKSVSENFKPTPKKCAPKQDKCGYGTIAKYNSICEKSNPTPKTCAPKKNKGGCGDILDKTSFCEDFKKTPKPACVRMEKSPCGTVTSEGVIIPKEAAKSSHQKSSCEKPKSTEKSVCEKPKQVCAKPQSTNENHNQDENLCEKPKEKPKPSCGKSEAVETPRDKSPCACKKSKKSAKLAGKPEVCKRKATEPSHEEPKSTCARSKKVEKATCGLPETCTKPPATETSHEEPKSTCARSKKVEKATCGLPKTCTKPPATETSHDEPKSTCARSKNVEKPTCGLPETCTKPPETETSHKEPKSTCARPEEVEKPTCEKPEACTKPPAAETTSEESKTKLTVGKPEVCKRKTSKAPSEKTKSVCKKSEEVETPTCGKPKTCPETSTKPVGQRSETAKLAVGKPEVCKRKAPETSHEKPKCARVGSKEAEKPTCGKPKSCAKSEELDTTCDRPKEKPKPSCAELKPGSTGSEPKVPGKCKDAKESKCACPKVESGCKKKQQKTEVKKCPCDGDCKGSDELKCGKLEKSHESEKYSPPDDFQDTRVATLDERSKELSHHLVASIIKPVAGYSNFNYSTYARLYYVPGFNTFLKSLLCLRSVTFPQSKAMSSSDAKKPSDPPCKINSTNVCEEVPRLSPEIKPRFVRTDEDEKGKPNKKGSTSACRTVPKRSPTSIPKKQPPKKPKKPSTACKGADSNQSTVHVDGLASPALRTSADTTKVPIETICPKRIETMLKEGSHRLRRTEEAYGITETVEVSLKAGAIELKTAEELPMLDHDNSEQNNQKLFDVKKPLKEPNPVLLGTETPCFETCIRNKMKRDEHEERRAFINTNKVSRNLRKLEKETSKELPKVPKKGADAAESLNVAEVAEDIKVANIVESLKVAAVEDGKVAAPNEGAQPSNVVRNAVAEGGKVGAPEAVKTDAPKASGSGTHPGDPHLTGISKYINGQTTTGRANGAKLTFATLGLAFIIYKLSSKKNKPPPE